MHVITSTILHFPRKCFVSQYKNETLYYSADSKSCVVVNEAGKEVLEASRDGGSVKQIAQRLIPGKEEFTEKLTTIILPFLNKMVDARFLQTQELLTAIEKPMDYDSAPAKLTDLYIHVTDQCNLNCLYCYNAIQRRQSLLSPDTKSLYVTRKLIFSIIDEAVKLGVKTIILTGGEPTLRKDLFAIARYAKEKGCTTSLLTNGTLINKKIAKQIKLWINSVIVSLDTWNRDEYETLCPGGSLQKAILGIRSLVEVGVSSLSIRPVITKYNVKSLPEFPDFARKYLGCIKFSPALYLPNNLEQGKGVEYLPDPDVYWESINQFHEALQHLGGSSSLQTMPIEAYGSCGAGGNGVLSIAANGNVYPCQCLHYDEFLSGNIKQQSISEILFESQILSTFRSERGKCSDHCKECSLLALCCSTCRVLHKAFKNHEKKFLSFMCPFFKKEIEKKLWHKARQNIDKNKS
jgi:radical SAM protein with 4Fe4S-binding SPASM domain